MNRKEKSSKICLLSAWIVSLIATLGSLYFFRSNENSPDAIFAGFSAFSYIRKSFF